MRKQVAVLSRLIANTILWLLRSVCGSESQSHGVGERKRESALKLGGIIPKGAPSANLAMLLPDLRGQQQQHGGVDSATCSIRDD
jgi:hypothetical protein